MKRIGKFVFNGIIMTVCSVIMRTVAVSFNIYVANTAGAEAVGLYSLLSSVYGFAVTLALSGLHLSVTRLVAEALATNNVSYATKIMKKSFRYALFFGLLSSALLFSLAGSLSTNWLCDTRAIKPLKILSLCLPLISISSVINGYFSAVRRVIKSGFSQLCEMAIKIAATVTLFSVILAKNAELACVLLVLGGAFSEACVFIINIMLYAHDRVVHFKRKERFHASKETTESPSRAILKIALPVAFTSYVRSALLSLEHSLIPKGLQKFGSDRTSALSSYGTLASMALPVINFPYALVGSFSSLLIPEVAECRAQGEKRRIRYIAYRTYQTGIAFAICIFGIFFSFSTPLGEILYSSSEAALYIKHLAPLVPIMYADSVTDAILKGMGEQLYSMKVNIADACISVLLVYLLVPKYGIHGYIATIYIAEIINASLSIFKMIKITGLRPPILKFIICPIICTAGAASVCSIISKTLISNSSTWGLAVGIIFYVFVYVLSLFCIGGLSKDDAKWIKKIFSKT